MRRLGPFELLEPLAEGGMGVVWRGMHTGQRVPVGIKLVGTDSRKARLAFRDEVQAMAGLHHPGVVMVFDYGEVPADFPDTPGVPPGASFLAMEYASFGSLKSRTGVMPWSQIRSTLLALLDALAHAHARGVVHRDLKPGNILLAGPEDVRPGLKLADFGLARALDRTDELESVTGTPLYMAPEQITRRWRDFGPWTDLYALGIVAWELAAGQAPFQGQSLPNIVNGHLTGQLPPFRPRVAVPRRFHAWLLRMLQTDLTSRYQRAADAAWELAQLGDPEEASGMDEPVFQAVLSNPTLTLDDTLLLLATGDVPELPVPEPEPEVVEAAPHPTPAEPPPIPPSWSRPNADEPPVQLLGVGLGLFGLRTVPLVDRVQERDRIWKSLREVYDTGETRLVCLRGAAGNGKSRLAEWIAQRAHEVGGASIVKAVHSPDPTPVDGIGPAMARWFRCVGLDRAAVAERIAGLCPFGLDADALTELVHPGDADDPGVRFGTPDERYEIARQVLEDAAETRPVILWLDDVQWGADALGFAEYVLDRPTPVLLLLTAQEEALAERDAERELVERLTAREDGADVPVEPLGEADSVELVRVLLGLEGGLADRLADRTGGNPLFTVQLVGDWVARGILVPGRTGFELQKGAEVDLPDSLHDVWAARLERVLDGQHADARESLEIAAALGQEVSAADWAEICAHAGLAADPGLVDAMIASRLANPTDEGWSFAHGMLRESIARLAREHGRWATANRRCADALMLRTPVPQARLGRHLFAAGDWAAAAEHVEAALQASFDLYIDQRTIRSLLDLQAQALQRMALPDDDPRWGDLWLARAAFYLEQNDPDSAQREARRTTSGARRYKWVSHGARAELALARIARARGDVSRASGMFATAVRAIERTGDTRLLPPALREMAHTLIMAGEIDAAEEPLARSRALYEANDDLRGLAAVVRFEGDIARLRLEYEKARQCFLDATAMNERAGLRSNAAATMHGVAEMERLLGNLDTAEGIYRRVIEMDRAVGESSDIPRLNLCLCLLARAKWADARKELHVLLARWVEQHKPGYAAVAHVTLVPANAGLGDWQAYDHHLAEAHRLCNETGMIDIDVALCCEKAGGIAAEAGHANRALRAYELALLNWEQLGEMGRADDLRDRMDAL
ncbi:MAG: protein kinase [Alphaproteobacteria bacterium]|nr:protein kinase [Alphaproteobacteria bacterium]